MWRSNLRCSCSFRVCSCSCRAASCRSPNASQPMHASASRRRGAPRGGRGARIGEGRGVAERRGIAAVARGRERRKGKGAPSSHRGAARGGPRAPPRRPSLPTRGQPPPQPSLLLPSKTDRDRGPGPLSAEDRVTSHRPNNIDTCHSRSHGAALIEGGAQLKSLTATTPRFRIFEMLLTRGAGGGG